MKQTRRKLTRQQSKFSTCQAAFRSGLEVKAAEQIRAAGLTVHYEEMRLAYTVPQSEHRYTPDFVLPNGIIIETKGLFSTEDRQKMRLIRRQYPDLDIRMVFSNAKAKIAKQSPTTYAKWCDTYGFPWADKVIPHTWLTEPATPHRLAAVGAATVPPTKH